MVSPRHLIKKTALAWLLTSVGLAIASAAFAANSADTRASTSLDGPIDTPALEAQINDLLDGFHHAAATADGADSFNRFAADGIFMGTDASERWTVAEFKTYAKPSFTRGRDWKLNHYSLTLLIPNSVADDVGALTQSVDRKAEQSEREFDNNHE